MYRRTTFSGDLEDEGTNVNARAVEVLSRGNREPTALHRDLLRLYSKPASVRIVTTNFDSLFEQSAASVFESLPDAFEAPALPLGTKFSGIVHLHGSIDRADDMVLTDKDFGRAYLTEGWARRFLVALFRVYTVLFVGYSHNDIVTTYLARALPIGEAKRFALARATTDIDRWRLLGIEPVIYPKSSGDDHQALGLGVRGLAEHSRRGVLDWRREIKEIAEKPPSLRKSQWISLRTRSPIQRRRASSPMPLQTLNGSTGSTSGTTLPPLRQRRVRRARYTTGTVVWRTTSSATTRMNSFC